MRPVLITEAGRTENQDRGLILHDGPRLVLCVADGAGGKSGGAEAATMVMEMARQWSHQLVSANACVELLRKIDAAIAQDAQAGETTAVLVAITPTEVFGASVGDSGAWLIPSQGGHSDLTSGQQRKPFLGSGSALPIAFHKPQSRGQLLLATDGLLKYTSAENIVEACRKVDATTVVGELMALVRYPSGALPDDVTLILAKV